MSELGTTTLTTRGYVPLAAFDAAFHWAFNGAGRARDRQGPGKQNWFGINLRSIRSNRKSESSRFDVVVECRDEMVVVGLGFELVQYCVGLELVLGVEMILGFVVGRLSAEDSEVDFASSREEIAVTRYMH